MSRDELPCNCGKGKVVKIFRMDDWNRTETITDILCDDCRVAAGKRRNEEERRQKEKDTYKAKAIALAKKGYLPQWLLKFEGLTKKQVWETMPKSTYGYPSLSTFYTHVKHHGSVAQYLEWRFEADINDLFPTEIEDKEIVGLLDKSK